MKIIGITLLMMGCLMTFSFWLDYQQGIDLHTAYRNATSPFQVMDTVEMVVLIFFILVVIVELILSSYQKRKGTPKTE